MLKYAEAQEDYLIAQLVARDADYADDLVYECIPDQGTNEFNSNSFAAGLINAVVLPLPEFVTELGGQFAGRGGEASAGQ